MSTVKTETNRTAKNHITQTKVKKAKTNIIIMIELKNSIPFSFPFCPKTKNYDISGDKCQFPKTKNFRLKMDEKTRGQWSAGHQACRLQNQVSQNCFTLTQTEGTLHCPVCRVTGMVNWPVSTRDVYVWRGKACTTNGTIIAQKDQGNIIEGLWSAVSDALQA